MPCAHTLLCILFFCLPLFARAQYDMWADAGPTMNNARFKFYGNNSTALSIGYISSRFSTNALYHSAKRVNLGFAVALEFYEVNYSIDNLGWYPNSNYIIEKNSALLFSPILDYRIDAQNRWHLSLLPSLCFVLGDYEYWLTQGTDGQNQSMFRLGFRLQRNVRLTKEVSLTASMIYSFMMGRIMPYDPDYPAISSRLFGFSLGYMLAARKQGYTQTPATGSKQ